MISDEKQKSVKLWEEIEKDLLFAKKILSFEKETRADMVRSLGGSRSIETLRSKKIFPYRSDKHSKDMLYQHRKSGKATLQRIYGKIEDVEYDDELMALLGRLFFDIGFLVAYVELPSAEAAVAEFRSRLAVKPTVDDKRVWVARQLLACLDVVKNRELAEREVVARILRVIESGGHEGFPANWFKSLLVDLKKGKGPTASWALKTTFGGKALKNKELADWASRTDWPLPPDLPHSPG